LKDRGIQREKKLIERLTKRGESMRKKENTILSQMKRDIMRKKERRNCDRERI
jgi:hypothetical protein